MTADVTSGAWASWAATDAGAVRSGNEDTFIDRPDFGLWAVADGAGGHQHGEAASGLLKQVLERLEGVAPEDLVAEVRSGVSQAHRALRARAETEARQLGGSVTIASTLVVLLADDLHFACLWAGDSRAYHLRDGALSRLTRDHSLVQDLVDAGELAQADAESHPHANVITRAIGANGPDIELDKVTGRAEPGDRFLLCSDGLTRALDEAAIAPLAGGHDPAQALIAAALDAGARDNVTAVVLEFRALDEDWTVLSRPGA